MNYISADIVDIIYFADSYGNLLAEDVASLINLFKSIWNQSWDFMPMIILIWHLVML